MGKLDERLREVNKTISVTRRLGAEPSEFMRSYRKVLVQVDLTRRHVSNPKLIKKFEARAKEAIRKYDAEQRAKQKTSLDK